MIGVVVDFDWATVFALDIAARSERVMTANAIMLMVRKIVCLSFKSASVPFLPWAGACVDDSTDIRLIPVVGLTDLLSMRITCFLR